MIDPGFTPGTLSETARKQSQLALANGSLQPIQTHSSVVEDGPIQFAVRIVSSLTRKATQKKLAPKQSADGKPFNPFLPYDQSLFVTHISPTHACLLNKFKVIDQHLLIVTRAFEEQQRLLTQQDLDALWCCLVEFNSLGFYNGGPAAGASQRHKHLQLVPLPLGSNSLPVPIQPLIDQSATETHVLTGFPFRHAFARLSRSTNRVNGATEALQVYLSLLDRLQLRHPDGLHQSGPYNLLTTRDWMLVVPRSQECFQNISINALGFAGSFFVKNEPALEALRAGGPINALAHVSLPQSRE